MSKVEALWAVYEALAKVPGTTRDGEREARSLIHAGLAFLSDDPELAAFFGNLPHGPVTRDDVVRAHDALVRMESVALDHHRVGRMIEIGVAAASAKGTDAAYAGIAQALVRALHQPKRLAPELARRMRGWRKASKQGRSPAGSFTTAQIVEWLTGEKPKRKKRR